MIQTTLIEEAYFARQGEKVDPVVTEYQSSMCHSIMEASGGMDRRACL